MPQQNRTNVRLADEVRELREQVVKGFTGIKLQIAALSEHMGTRLTVHEQREEALLAEDRISLSAAREMLRGEVRDMVKFEVSQQIGSEE
jgi:hypothetical protein